MNLDAAAGATRKVAWRIVPFLCLLYVFNILDRANVGFARLGMTRDLGLADAVIDWGYGLFYVGYLVFEVPSNLLLRKFGARVWISRIMITWGLVSMLTLAVLPSAMRCSAASSAGWGNRSMAAGPCTSPVDAACRAARRYRRTGCGLPKCFPPACGPSMRC